MGGGPVKTPNPMHLYSSAYTPGSLYCGCMLEGRGGGGGGGGGGVV